MAQTIEYEPVKPKRENPFKGFRFRAIIIFAGLAVALGWGRLCHECIGSYPDMLLAVVALASGAIAGGVAFFGLLFTGRLW